MLKLNDGRSELWQWDTGRKLTVDADCSQIHFSNKIFGRSIDVDVVDGVAIIPDVLLQTDNDLNAWAFVGTAENGYTKIAKEFKIHKRNKPSDYVYTPVEQVTLREVIDRLEELEKGGGGSGESGKDGATFIPSVSSDGVISWTNDGGKQNPDPVNIKGAKGDKGDTGDDYTLTEADKQEIAEMASELVPSGGGGSGEFPLLAEIILTEEVSTITIDKDTSGNPLEVSEMYVSFMFNGGTPNEKASNVVVYLNNANTAVQRHSLGGYVPATSGDTSVVTNQRARVLHYQKLKYG